MHVRVPFHGGRCKGLCRTYVPSDRIPSLGEPMFWSHENREPVESIGHYLKEELRLRLRVAADFATLGAYELSGPEDVEDAPVERAHALREDPPQRVFLFAKVAPVCPHSADSERACTGHADAQERSQVRRARRPGAARQRGGAVRPPAQPCLCAGARVPAA